jgi:hypothetical protein
VITPRMSGENQVSSPWSAMGKTPCA